MNVSACIICCNEQDKISLCLDSLAWCSDIVLVDSGSTDRTLEIASSHPAAPRIVPHPWQGYSLQRHFAASCCRNDWVLMLDADEECSPELARQILALSDSHAAKVALYRMPRKNYIGGRYVRCWSPDYQTRLAHRQRLLWQPESIPEIRQPAEGFTRGTLRGSLLHNRLTPFSQADLVDGALMAERAQLLAATMYKNGQRASPPNLLARPIATFIKYYILRGAFLDGRFGLLIAYKTTVGVVLKYSALYALERVAVKSQAPPPDRPGPP